MRITYNSVEAGLRANKMLKRQKGRVDAPGPSSTVRDPNQVAMGILKRKALQGSSGTYLQGSAPDLQGFNSGSTRRLQ